mgnify:CR=1 FL=1
MVIGPAQYVPPVVPAQSVADHFTSGWARAHRESRSLRGSTWRTSTASRPSAGIRGVLGCQIGRSDGGLRQGLGRDRRRDRRDRVGGAGRPQREDLRSPDRRDSRGVSRRGGRRGDAFWLADETLRIPLVRVAHLTDAPAGTPQHDSRPTWLPDVAESLRRAVGAADPAGADGVALEVAPRGAGRLAWSFALDDQLAWPPLTAVKEGDVLSVFEASGNAGVRPVGPVSASATAAAGARPALPRRRVLPEANRRAVEHERLKLGHPTTPAARPANTDAWLNDLMIVRRFLSMKRPTLAGRSSKRLLSDAPESFAALVTRLYVLSSAWSDELVEVRDKLLGLYPERAETLHWAAHVSAVGFDPAAAAALLDAAIAVGPVEPEIYYDRACAHALRGETEPALRVLETAINAGFRNWDWIDKDPDLAALRAKPEFAELMKAHGR